MLTSERLKQLFRYEPETGLFCRLVAPGKRSDLVGSINGADATRGYISVTVDGIRYKAHRLAWFYVTGSWPVRDIDHKDRNKTNNAWCNLRLAERAENEANKPPSKANTSGVKGVYWNKAAKKWQAYIKRFGKVKYLGIFDVFEDAIKARQSAEDELFGAFAFREAA